MSHKNILFVCEGNDDEKLLNILLNNYIIDLSFSIYKYNTNIHLFAKHLFRNYSLDNGELLMDEIDIIQILKEFRYEKNLDKKYTDILFVFDYDPQDPRFNPEMLMKLVKTFSDSTDIGQLFINYPMVEASLDFTSLPDPEYNNKVCKLNDIKFNGYKNHVKKNSVIKYFDNIHKDDLRVILKQTLEKMNFLTKGKSYDYSCLLDVQNELLRKFETISIISTCLLFIRDFNEDRFLEYIDYQGGQ